MNKLLDFESAQKAIRSLDFQGYSVRSPEMYREFQERNSFGLDLASPIHRIFQCEYLKKDIADGCVTLPKASASVWKDSLENPLSGVYEVDLVTGQELHLGSLVSSFHALCWTHREKAHPSDWSSFSHGRDAVRVSTTVGKLMDRVMRVDDPAYMHRAWLIEVDYDDPVVIGGMQNPAEVYRRMESQGALLALSAAVVRTENSDEDEVRLLLNPSVRPEDPAARISGGPDLLRIPFEWAGFIDFVEQSPW